MTRRKHHKKRNTLLIITALMCALTYVAYQHRADIKRWLRIQWKRQTTEVSHDYNGIDVSSHQKKINWEIVAQNENIEFVYVKITEGTTYQDRLGQHNIREARRHGLNVGAYHYLTTKSPAKTQFKNFKKQYCDEANLIPMLDVEERGNFHDKEWVALAKEMADLMEEEFGVKPIIYTTLALYNGMLYPTFKDYTIYIGYYESTPPHLKGDQRGYLWQYADVYSIDGIEKAVDQVRFVNMTVDDLLLPYKK